MDKAGDVILCDNKAKNVVIAKAIARIFNAVSVQKNKPEWSCYFVTMPKHDALLHGEEYVFSIYIKLNDRRMP
ncbi:MAG: hypothetical protein L3J11_09710 [Draconibacterium sp.]|nr:hypothetical protein [Draconibacterium sp.]